MDHVQVRPSSSGRRQLKAAPFMRREYYTQVHCLPASCVAPADQNEIREDLRRYNGSLKNTAQVLMDQYVWRTASNLPGNLYRVESRQPGRRKGSGLQPSLSQTTPELERQVPVSQQGVLAGAQSPARPLTYEQSALRESVDDSLRRVGPAQQLSESFWKTKKDLKAHSRIFRGGQSEELDLFATKKRPSALKRDLYSSHIALT